MVVVVVVVVVTVFRYMARLIPFPPLFNWTVTAFSMTQYVIYFILQTKNLYQKAHCLYKMLHRYRCGLAYRVA